MSNMRRKLSNLKDILVFALSFEVNVILTLFLFDVEIWGSLWSVAKVNIAILFFYGWLLFIDLYLNNYSTSAVEERRRLAKQGIYVEPEPLFKKRVVEPKPKAKPKVKPEPKVEPKVEPVVEPKAEPVVEVKPEPVAEPKPEPVVPVQPEPVVEAPVQKNREQILAWIKEEENKEGN